jgi:hypothetical protein
MTLLSSLAVLLTALTVVLPLPVTSSAHELRELTAENFKQNIEKGLWFVDTVAHMVEDQALTQGGALHTG